VTLARLVVTASTLTTACGVGWAAQRAALRDGRTGLRRNDFAPAADLDTCIGRVDGLEAMSLEGASAPFDCRNHRLATLALTQDGFAGTVERARTRYGAARIGVFVGTSTSGILDTELAARAQGANGPWAFGASHYRYVHGMAAPTRFLCHALGVAGVRATVSTACSSSAKVFAMAQRAIAAGQCDAAVVAGIDSLALSTLQGFRALQLLSKRPCRPFGADRDGISIGEAAGFALLERDGDGVALVGTGESSDAFHMSSPSPDGAGAQAAMRAALAAAGIAPRDVDYVNMHGTGTPANDAAEGAAVAAVVGGDVPCSSTKGWTGHALGAAGIVEALFAVDAIASGMIPGNLGGEDVDPRVTVKIEHATRAHTVRRAMSNSFGFGGSNCSLVFAA
jgi:3-oxoacyl-[acyl-carrier-protein] synthase-1